jgi:hypothetical protein
MEGGTLPPKSKTKMNASTSNSKSNETVPEVTPKTEVTLEDEAEEEEEISCESCGRDEGIIVHNWGCVALCAMCSLGDHGEPHCPRTSRSGEAEECEWCVSVWAGKRACCDCAALLTAEEDVGNNADVGETCCRVCFDEEMERREEEKDLTFYTPEEWEEAKWTNDESWSKWHETFKTKEEAMEHDLVTATESGNDIWLLFFGKRREVDAFAKLYRKNKARLRIAEA